jgi:hypothetical protein
LNDSNIIGISNIGINVAYQKEAAMEYFKDG